MITLRHFNLSEFESPDAPGSGDQMNEAFLELLDEIREKAGFAFVINSGYRTQNHNVRAGGSLNSAHTRGLAADIKADSGIKKYRIVVNALLKGVPRVGIGKNFVHLDIDTTLPHPCIWVY